MRGIIASGAYLPWRRLDRSELKAVFGKEGGSGTRTHDLGGYPDELVSFGTEPG